MEIFGRNIKVVIESIAKDTKVFSSEDDFRIEFDAQFGTRATSTIKIWNALPSTVEMCKPQKANSKESKYAKIELSVGFGEDLFLLTSASILSVEQIINGLDRVLEIKAVAKSDLLQNVYVLDTYENQTVSSIIRNIFSSNSISSYSINLEDNSIIPSISLNGTLQRTLSELCKKANAVWYERNGKLFVESKSARSKRDSELIVLNSESGLLGSPEVSGTKLKVRSLLNSKLNYGTVFQMEFKDVLNDQMVKGDYKVQNGKHFGGNKTQDFTTELECVKV